MKLVERITKISKKQGMSLPDLETAVNLGYRTIRKWDEIDPGSIKLSKVADYLEVDARYLLTGEPTSFDAPLEQKIFLRNYEKLTPKQQLLIDELIYSFDQKIHEGESDKACEIAEKMLRNEVSVDDVIRLTDLDEKTVKRLKRSMKKKIRKPRKSD